MMANEGTLQAPVIDDENQSSEVGKSELIPATDVANEDWVTLSEIEGRYVTRVLEHTGGNKQAAARILAVDRKTLDRMIKRHNINSHHARSPRVKVSDSG